MLITISTLSLLGVLFMLYKKIVDIEPHLNNETHHGHSNFIIDYTFYLRNQVKQYFTEIYTELRPHLHDLMSYVASKMYKLSSAAAQEFLRFYNFVQGRKELKKTANASAFIIDMEEHKVASRNVGKRSVYQTQTANK
ncbi:MAG: hypothetical protein HY226_05875 [Candidatus Vogelbacteria bacterium]|nr:hypothetical protein [Candidatus Vogelbacteria bacterium]